MMSTPPVVRCSAMDDGSNPGPEQGGLGADEESFPPPVSVGLDDSIGTYWDSRVRQSCFDWYAGVPINKFPEDLRVYEHLLWASRADVVVEIGTDYGGSALWFRDRLATMARYRRITRPGRVFSIDL